MAGDCRWCLAFVAAWSSIKSVSPIGPCRRTSMNLNCYRPTFGPSFIPKRPLRPIIQTRTMSSAVRSSRFLADGAAQRLFLGRTCLKRVERPDRGQGSPSGAKTSSKRRLMQEAESSLRTACLVVLRRRRWAVDAPHFVDDMRGKGAGASSILSPLISSRSSSHDARFSRLTDLAGPGLPRPVSDQGARRERHQRGCSGQA